MNYYKQRNFMKTSTKSMLFALIILVTTGCISSREFHPVKNYDIGQPTIGSAPAFELKRFTIDKRYNKNLLVRTSDTTVEHAPYSRWVIAPEALLSNYIRGAATQEEPVGTLEVNILAIELREDTKTAYFVADYTLKTSDKTFKNRVEQSTTIKEFTPKLFAQAYREFADKLITDLKQNLTKK
jgi:hypothetical protein